MGEQRVKVSGRIVADSSGLSIEPRTAPDQLTASETGRIEPRTDPHLALIGLPGSDLPNSRSIGDSTQAWAEVSGVLTADGELRVETCDPLTSLFDFWTPEPVAVMANPPHAVPPGSPPFPSAGDDIERQMVADDIIISRKILRTPAGGRVLVISTTQPDEVERLLRPVYARHLVVRDSPWTAAQYRAATDTLNDRFSKWGLLLLGDHVGDAGQVRIIAAMFAHHPEAAEWVSSQPTGLVELRPWIRPTI